MNVLVGKESLHVRKGVWGGCLCKASMRGYLHKQIRTFPCKRYPQSQNLSGMFGNNATTSIKTAAPYKPLSNTKMI